MTTTKYASLYPSVAPRSTELVQIVVHGAANVPTIQDRLPRCYLMICNQSEIGNSGDNHHDLSSGTVNCTNAVESDSPFWNEILILTVTEDYASREVLVLMIIDEPTQRVLVRYEIYWSWLIPFHQYHLNLKSLPPTTNQRVSLYISIMKKLSTLHKDNSRYYGFETVIDRFDIPLAKNIACYAVVRVVPDYEHYRAEHLDKTDRKPPKLHFKKIDVPSQQDFILPDYTIDGYPQVSLSSRKLAIPSWKQNFYFTQTHERDAMFGNRGAGLVIELYNAYPIANNKDWHLNALIGWTVIRLDGRTRDALISQAAINGMRTEGLFIEHEGDLVPASEKHPSMRLFVRLIAEKHPVKNLLTMMSDDLPVLPSYQAESQVQGGPKPVYTQIRGNMRAVFPPIASARPPAIRSPVNTNKSFNMTTSHLKKRRNFLW